MDARQDPRAVVASRGSAESLPARSGRRINLDTCLGRSYRLTLKSEGTGVRLDRGRFHLPSGEVDQGAEAMQRWYTEVGTKWLRKRIRPWAARLGKEFVRVEVRDLGFRWASARPSDGPPRMNIHWATLQLPPSLIDYVLVHELAHLREANHTPEFWFIVERLMPGYQASKTTLAAVGRNIWLGRTVSAAENQLQASDQNCRG